MVLTEQQLTAFLPRLQANQWVGVLNEAIDRFEINSPARTAAFLAQVAHESGEFKHLTENLNYSASALRRVWPRFFPTLEEAQGYERRPEKIANRVYANRLGNSDTASGDGWKFRGRGLIQLTGRGNYQFAGMAIGMPLEANPELVETPRVAALTAAQFWYSHRLNQLADDRNDDDDDRDFERIGVLISGGRLGLDSRRSYWERAKLVFQPT